MQEKTEKYSQLGGVHRKEITGSSLTIVRLLTARVAKWENGENGIEYEIALWLLERTFLPGHERNQEGMCGGTDVGCDGGRCPRNKYQNTFSVSGNREAACTRVLDQ